MKRRASEWLTRVAGLQRSTYANGTHRKGGQASRRRHDSSRSAPLPQSDIELPPSLLSGEDSVSGFLWWSHFGSFRSYEGSASNHIIDLLAGALLYADGHSAPSCSSILGHHKVIPDSSIEMDHPVAVIQKAHSRLDATQRFVRSKKETDCVRKAPPRSQNEVEHQVMDLKSMATIEDKETSCSQNANQKLSHQVSINVHSVVDDSAETPKTGEKEYPSTKPSAANDLGEIELSALVGSYFDEQSDFHRSDLSHTQRLQIAHAIQCIKEGSEIAIVKHFTLVVNVLLHAGDGVGIPSDLIEAPDIEACFGIPRKGRGAMFLPGDAFIALLIALVASRSHHHALVYECIRTVHLCGISIPDASLRSLCRFLSMDTVGHSNAATRLLDALCLEGVDAQMLNPTNNAIQRLLKEKEAYGSQSASLIQSQGTRLETASQAHNNAAEPVANALCVAMQDALRQGSLSEATRLLDTHVPCLVRPSRTELIVTIFTSAIHVEMRRHLLEMLRGRCSVTERFAFDAHVGELAAMYGSNFGVNKRALDATLKNKGSKLQRALRK